MSEFDYDVLVAGPLRLPLVDIRHSGEAAG